MMYDHADWSLIPPHMIGSLHRYIENGIAPGSFLMAVLTNDLRRAVECADEVNRHRLPDYVRFLYCFAPIDCWGNPAKVDTWIAHKGLGLEHVCRD